MSSTIKAYHPFRHAVTGELDRLQALAEMHDPTTHALLAALVRPGWRCLDVGAGAGAVSAQLTALVGSSGMVVATDIETTYLRPLARSGVEVVEHDITTAPVPGPRFDLVVSRFMLEWVPDREAALRHMLASVRPGGVLMVETGDWWSRIPAAHPAHLDMVIAAAVKVMEGGGYETDSGRRLPARLEALRLTRVAGRTISLLGRGGDTPAARWALGSLDRIARCCWSGGL